MIRISTIFIAACMALIAASIGAVAYYVLKFDPVQAGLVALVILTLMLLYNAVAAGARRRGDASAQIADLSRGTADLARQVAEYGRRLGALETKLGDGDTRAATGPLANEISELGAIVRQLAQSVAAHEEALGKGRVAAAIPAAVAAAHASGAPGAPEPDELSDAADASELAAAVLAETAHDMTADGEPAGGASAGPDPTVMTMRVRNAIESNRLDLYLQPLVTLPQRKVRFYEAMSRLRDDAGTAIAATDFIGIAEQSGQMPRIDHMVIFRCVQVLRRLQVKTKDVGLFCNLSRTTLGDAEVFGQCLDFLQANRALAPALVFEFRQAALKNLVPLESEHLARLGELGFRLSIDHVTELRLDPRELSDLGVKFVKVPARTLLEGGPPGLDIHPADLSDLLGRFGIDLVAEKIEGEKSVVDLLDYDVRYGQGFLFAPPRPLKPDNAADAPAGKAALAASAGR